jgi:methyl-accepting chemotaxis protein
MGGPSQPWPLVPVLALTDRLRASARLAVLVVVLLIPGAFAATSYLGVIGGQLNFTSQEQAGTVVLPLALDALSDTVAGNKPDLAPLAAATAAHPELALDDALSAVTSAAATLPAALPVRQRVPLATALVALITEVGNTSNLILDPDLDSFYVMDSQIVQVPRLLLAAARAGAPEAGGGDKLVAELAVRAGELSSSVDAIKSDVKTAVSNTSLPGLADQLTGLGGTGTTTATLATSITATLQHPGAVDGQPVAVAAKAGTASAVGALDALLAKRLAGFTGRRTTAVIVMVVGLVLAAWLALAVWWRTRRDVGMAVSAVKALADGDLAPRPMPAGGDEFGDIGRALSTARETLANQEEELRAAHAQREEQLREGLVRQRRSDAQFRERAQSAVDATAGVVVGELRDVVAQVDAVRGAASTISERVTAATEATRTVVDRANRAEQVVGALGDSLRGVASMAKTIAGIAGQTRLLALNATIEAARAGETGRGFTVVANEVKDLAVTTAESTKQITDTIASLEQDAADVATTIATMVDAIGQVDEVTAVLLDVAQDQYAVVEQLDTRVEQTVAKVHEMAHLSDRLEQRRYERVPTRDRTVLGIGGGQVEAELIDLSEEGLGCRVDPAVQVNEGTMIQVELTLTDGPLSIPARVAHVDRSGAVQQLGIEFNSTDMAVRLRIVDHLNTLRASAGRRPAPP